MEFIKKAVPPVALNLPVSFLISYVLLDLTLAPENTARYPDLNHFLIVYVIGFMVIAPVTSTYIASYWKDSKLQVNRRFITTLSILSIPFLFASASFALNYTPFLTPSIYIGIIALLPVLGVSVMAETIAGHPPFSTTFLYAVGAVFWSTLGLIVALGQEDMANDNPSSE